jgi:hypothetical protein
MSTNTSPKLKLLLILGQSQLEAMQEIRDNISVNPCLDLPNGLLMPYLAVPTHLMELFVEFFTLSWVVERWNLSSVSFVLSLFFTTNRREYDRVSQH